MTSIFRLSLLSLVMLSVAGFAESKAQEKAVRHLHGYLLATSEKAKEEIIDILKGYPKEVAYEMAEQFNAAEKLALQIYQQKYSYANLFTGYYDLLSSQYVQDLKVWQTHQKRIVGLGPFSARPMLKMVNDEEQSTPRRHLAKFFLEQILDQETYDTIDLRNEIRDVLKAARK